MLGGQNTGRSQSVPTISFCFACKRLQNWQTWKQQFATVAIGPRYYCSWLKPTAFISIQDDQSPCKACGGGVWM